MFLHGRGEREGGESVSGEEKDREKPASWESTNPLGGMPLNGASSLWFSLSSLASALPYVA